MYTLYINVLILSWRKWLIVASSSWLSPRKLHPPQKKKKKVLGVNGWKLTSSYAILIVSLVIDVFDYIDLTKVMIRTMISNDYIKESRREGPRVFV